MTQAKLLLKQPKYIIAIYDIKVFGGTAGH